MHRTEYMKQKSVSLPDHQRRKRMSVPRANGHRSRQRNQACLQTQTSSAAPPVARLLRHPPPPKSVHLAEWSHCRVPSHKSRSQHASKRGRQTAFEGGCCTKLVLEAIVYANLVLLRCSWIDKGFWIINGKKYCFGVAVKTNRCHNFITNLVKIRPWWEGGWKMWGEMPLGISVLSPSW